MIYLLLLHFIFYLPTSSVYMVPITLTAYEPSIYQTDTSPFITASNKQVRLGIVALSRDIEKKYNFKFGDVVLLENHGMFVFEDRMNKKWKNRIDIFMYNGADLFGKRKDNLIIFNGGR